MNGPSKLAAPISCKQCFELQLCFYSADSIKRTVLLKVLSGSLSIKNTVFNSDFKKISIKNTVYQEKEVREKLNVRYV